MAITKASLQAKLDRLVAENRIVPCVFKASPGRADYYAYSIRGVEEGNVGEVRFKSLQEVYTWLDGFEETDKKGS